MDVCVPRGSLCLSHCIVLSVTGAHFLWPTNSIHMGGSQLSYTSYKYQVLSSYFLTTIDDPPEQTSTKDYSQQQGSLLLMALFLQLHSKPQVIRPPAMLVIKVIWQDSNKPWYSESCRARIRIVQPVCRYLGQITPGWGPLLTFFFKPYGSHMFCTWYVMSVTL